MDLAGKGEETLKTLLPSGAYEPEGAEFGSGAEGVGLAFAGPSSLHLQGSEMIFEDFFATGDEFGVKFFTEGLVGDGALDDDTGFAFLYALSKLFIANGDGGAVSARGEDGGVDVEVAPIALGILLGNASGALSFFVFENGPEVAAYATDASP